MANDYAELQRQINELREEVKKLKPELDKATSAADSFVTKIGEGDKLFKSITQSVKSVYTEIFNFGKSLTAQYRLGEQLAKSFKQTSVNIGIGYQNQKILGNEFNKSVMLVERLGGNMDDVNSIYSKFADQSGRVRILDDEEVQRIFAIEQATGLMGDSATALAERFDLMGVGSEQFAENINQVLKDSQKLGLNSSKVVKVLSDNFESMQRMSFKGGVKAMTEMSKLSVKMRMNISDMLGTADRFYEPEAAIEAAANLQLLGGEIANSFGDPLQMMFEARNAPEELLGRVGDVTKGLVKFNEQTGQFDLLAENRQKLIGMADALGINKDQLIDTAFQMNKMQRIKMDVGGNLFDEDTMDKISSLAKFDKTSGQWTVDVSGEAVAVEDLNTDQIEQALATPSTEEDAIMATAKAAMTTNETLQALLNATQTGIVIKTDVYGKVENQLSTQLSKITTTTNELMESITKTLGSTDYFKNLGGIGEQVSSVISDSTTDVIDNISENLNKYLGSLDTLYATGTNIIINSNKPPEVKPSAELPKPPSPKPAGDLYSGPGDSNRVLTGSFGAFQLSDKDLVAAGDPKKLLSSVNAPQKMDIGGTLNFGDITISLDGSTETLSFSDSDKKEMMKSIKNEIIKGTTSILSGGYTDGKTSNTNI